MESVWSKEVEIPQRSALKENLSVEVVVIGGGMAGILTAYALKCQRKEVVVLEADRIAGGQTRNTTAKLTCQQGMIYDKLIKHYGKEEASAFARANKAAIDAFEWLIQEKKVCLKHLRMMCRNSRQKNRRNRRKMKWR